MHFTAPKQVSSTSLCLRVLVYTILRTNTVYSWEPSACTARGTNTLSGKLDDTCMEAGNISVLSHVLQSRLWAMFRTYSEVSHSYMLARAVPSPSRMNAPYFLPFEILLDLSRFNKTTLYHKSASLSTHRKHFSLPAVSCAFGCSHGEQFTSSLKAEGLRPHSSLHPLQDLIGSLASYGEAKCFVELNLGTGPRLG